MDLIGRIDQGCLIEEIARMQAEGFAQPPQAMQSDILFAALDRPDIRAVNAHFLRHGFLTQMDSAALSQDIRPDKSLDVHREVRGHPGILMLRIIIRGRRVPDLKRVTVGSISKCAPSSDQVVEYDRRNLALYAALIEADDSGRDWREVACSIMRLDLEQPDAEACWRSHLERARWIISDGMEAAVTAFSFRPGGQRE